MKTMKKTEKISLCGDAIGHCPLQGRCPKRSSNGIGLRCFIEHHPAAKNRVERREEVGGTLEKECKREGKWEGMRKIEIGKRKKIWFVGRWSEINT